MWCGEGQEQPKLPVLTDKNEEDPVTFCNFVEPTIEILFILPSYALESYSIVGSGEI